MMVNLKILLLALLITGCAEDRAKSTRDKKTESIQSEFVDSANTTPIDQKDSALQQKVTWVNDIPFKKELFDRLNNLSDTIYILSRLQLEKLKPVINTDSIVSYNTTSQTNNKYEILIKTKNFDYKNHSFTTDTLWQSEDKFYVMSNNIIDGRKIYGVDGTVPTKEIESFEIEINEKEISFPLNVIDDLYNLNTDLTEVYESRNGQYLYIYMNGADGAASYSVKLVFSSKGYITRIVAVLCGFNFIDGIEFDCV